MTFWAILGAVGLLLSFAAAIALAVIAYARLADRLEALWRERRAGAPGPETASAQEAGVAHSLGYDLRRNRVGL